MVMNLLGHRNINWREVNSNFIVNNSVLKFYTSALCLLYLLIYTEFVYSCSEYSHHIPEGVDAIL